jgi:hypothetical protein
MSASEQLSALLAGIDVEVNASCAGGFRIRRISVGQFVLSPNGVPRGWRLQR